MLADARKRQGLSAQRVADLIARDLGLRSLTSQAVYMWESFDRHPPIDKYAAWARVLGLQLIVELDDGGAPRMPVLVTHDEAAAAARVVDGIPDDEKRQAVLAMIEALAR